MYVKQGVGGFQRWGIWLVFIGRTLPGARTIVNIPAGLARMPFGWFVIATFFGAYLWCTLLITAGYFLGHEWPLISAYVRQALPYLLALGAIALAGYLWLSSRFLAPAYAPVQNDDE